MALTQDLLAHRDFHEITQPLVHRGGLPGYRLNRVLGYIADNLTVDLSLPQLAAIAGMSPHYFSELFRQSVGTTPHRYVLLRRIERAKQNLRDSKYTVMEAGLDAGFQNPSHFARMFRRFVGVSPSRFQFEQESSSATSTWHAGTWLRSFQKRQPRILDRALHAIGFGPYRSCELRRWRTSRNSNQKGEH